MRKITLILVSLSYMMFATENSVSSNEYIHEISDITGATEYTPKNPNTLWYKTSAEATGVSYPWRTGKS